MPDEKASSDPVEGRNPLEPSSQAIESKSQIDTTNNPVSQTSSNSKLLKITIVLLILLIGVIGAILASVLVSDEEVEVGETVVGTEESEGVEQKENDNQIDTEESDVPEEIEELGETEEVEISGEESSCIASGFDLAEYDHGDSYTTLDDCQTCTCNDGNWDCVVNPICEIGPTDCLYTGTVYYDGDSFPSIDGCNTCNCTGGIVGCTMMLCP